jgi:hypothetical protein
MVLWCPVYPLPKHAEHSSPLSMPRVMCRFGQMAAGMAFGTLGESAGRLLFGGAPAGGNAFISEGNAERLAAGLAR